jgi:hypothetical protein
VTTAPSRQDKQHLGTRDGEIKPEGRIKVLRKRVDFSVFLKSPVQEKGIPFKVADTAWTTDFLGQYRPHGSS